MGTQDLYNKRVDDIIKTSNHIEPVNVPVLGNVLTWAIGYAGGDTNELLDNPSKLPQVWTKFYDDVYIDCQFMYGLSTPIRALERLGSNTFFVSSDKHTIQHKENCLMNVDDYDYLLRDPEDFLINELGTRKFPELNKSRQEAKEALKDAMISIIQFKNANSQCIRIAKEKYGIVPMFGNHKVYPTLDVLFDRLRGFKGTITDIRRQRDNVIKACDALYPFYEKLTLKGEGEFPFASSTLHCPTFLRPKDFKEIFWPSMKDYIMNVYSKGSKTLLFMEGTWKPLYDIMKDELPKNSVLCMLEADDIVEAKGLIGDHFTIIGGVNTDFLRYKTQEECIDEAKRIVDLCAPGGGFIYSTEKSLCTYGDVDVKNFIAVNNFVHEYGKY